MPNKLAFRKSIKILISLKVNRSSYLSLCLTANNQNCRKISKSLGFFCGLWHK